ncbi:MAG TPA: GntR family transcriptional regulator [Hyphomicrobiales bacterium]|nr:GntR family transcriptional regulator [Hyphomicrobiales bacterium]
MNKENQDLFPSLRIDRKQPATPQVYNHLRSMIMSLAVPPGTSLSRALVAERFGVSQQPVRDALIKLEEEGLVDTYPQSSTKVSKIDLQSVHEEQCLRLSVELETVRMLAMKADQLDFFPIEMLILQQERLFQRGDIADFAEADREMHRTMMELAGIPGLWSVIRSRSGHLDRLRNLHLPTPGKASSVIEGHKRVLDAILSGNPAKAQDALRTHLSGTIASVEELRTLYPDYLSD